MKRKLNAILLTIILFISMQPLTASAITIPTSWKAPNSLVAAPDPIFPYATNLFFSVDSELIKFIDNNRTDYEALGIDSIGHTAQIDWKLNDGKWHYSSDWDTQSGEYDANSAIYDSTGYLDGSTTDDKAILDLRSSLIQNELKNAMIKGGTDEENRLDLQNNTFYFRVRLLVNYNVTKTSDNRFIFSPWSETLAYGKGGVSLQKPSKLEKPTISDPKVGKNSDGLPNITFTAITPKQVQDANTYTNAHEGHLGTGASIEAEHQININNTGWVKASAGAWWLAAETRSIDVPVTYDNGKTVTVDKAYIQVRMRYTFAGGNTVGPLQSEWSNVISVNTPGWSSASTWATTELQKASDLGLIPDILKGTDMTKPITREEFCELSVLLYEKVTEKTAEAASPNLFTDTTNQQILKAYKLGITSGTSTTTFSPKVLINREQCAAMLFRAIKAIKPEGDYSIAGIKDFHDQKVISRWAVESTKYMSKMGIVTGDSQGNFMPKATTTVQEATGYGMATREQAIAMVVRSFNKIM